MARYFPQDDVESRGRKLIAGSRTHSRLLEQLKEGEEELVGAYNNGVRKLCVNLTRESEYDHFEQQYNDGDFLSCEFYGLPPEPVDVENQPLVDAAPSPATSDADAPPRPSAYESDADVLTSIFYGRRSNP